MNHNIVLAADVGGTNTRLALFGGRVGGAIKLLRQETYRSQDHSSLETLMQGFLGDDLESIGAATIAVAGPVVDGKSILTNLPWEMDASVIMAMLRIQAVELINDQVGLAHFVASISSPDRVDLNDVPGRGQSVIAILAAGTGLGEGFLVWNGARYCPQASEGGHVDFAPTTEQQVRLLQFMMARHRRVSVERVCSGLAFPALYEFMRDIEGISEPTWMKSEVEAAVDKTPVIVNIAESERDDNLLCTRVVALFVELLAQEAGNLVLKVLPLNGLYLGGGIPPRILGALQKGFMPRFVQKGRMSPLMESIPVHVVVHPNATLFGAAHRAIELAG